MTAEGSPGREDSAAASEAEDAAEGSEPAAKDSKPGDTRLRDAVAAWVAGADTGAEGSGSGSGSDDRESRAGAESDGDVEGDGDAAASGDEGTAPEAGVGAEEARTDSEAGSDSAEGSDSEPDEAVAGDDAPGDASSATSAEDADAELASGTAVDGDAGEDRHAGGSEARRAEDAERPDDEAADGADPRSAESTGEDAPAGGRGSGAEESATDAASGEDASGDAEGAESTGEDALAGGRGSGAEESATDAASGEDASGDAEGAELSGEDALAGGRRTGAGEAEGDAVSGGDGEAVSAALKRADVESVSGAAAEGAAGDVEDDSRAGGSDAERVEGAEPSGEDTPAEGRRSGADEEEADAGPDGDAVSAALKDADVESVSGAAAEGAAGDVEDDSRAGGSDAERVEEAEPSGEDTPAGGRSADADEPEADAVPGGEATPDPGPDAEADSAPAQDAEDAHAKRDPRAGGGDAPAAGRDVDGEPGTGAGEDEPKRPVDQPTAAFKVRAPAVDQPTTTLKVGDAKPDEKPAAAERESERTSKFVALKPLDGPAPPREKPAVAPEEKPAVPPAAETAAIAQVGPERTAQQPLPPKPPLDLLAELTNTPPPRETPVRTIVRRVKIWTPLVILLAVVFAVVQAVRPLPTPALALTADKSYTFEGDKVTLPWPQEGQGWMDVNGIGTVDNFGQQKPVAIGSVAKAMVAYVILKDHPLKPGDEGKNIPVDAKAETEGGYDKDGESTLNTIKEGDTLTQRQALAAIMIPSANNVARLLARWDSNGSEEAFVKKMNDAAADLGMKNTKYTDPSGLKESTVSTAEDQVKLGNELVQMKALTDITKLPTWKDPSGREWQNYNRLVPYDNAIGIKTGSTTKAGGNLLFAATEDVEGEIVTVVGAILGQHQPPIIDTVNAVSKTAMVAAQDALTSSKILKKGDVVGYVDDGLGGRTPVVVTQDVSAVGWAGKTVELDLSDDGTEIPHEAKAGTKVGALSVGDGTGDAVEVPVALQSDLTEPGYGSKLTRVS
ncbi:D-alanyl-D-alanine carboxypeptidase [Streptomyces vastus]|uniref:D-alanyl-D-alanine carboxypeptidase n=1 Tax=Streptomyces vastus TaxID=285451 RepID=UPI003CD0A29A